MESPEPRRNSDKNEDQTSINIRFSLGLESAGRVSNSIRSGAVPRTNDRLSSKLESEVHIWKRTRNGANQVQTTG